MSKVRTGDGKRAGRGDVVSVPAYGGRTAVVIGTRRGCALLEFGPGRGEEWLPGSDVELAGKRRGIVTADGYQVVPGMAVTTAGGGYAVHGVTGKPGWLDRLSGTVPVTFAGGTECRCRGTDLYAAGEEDLYPLWT